MAKTNVQKHRPKVVTLRPGNGQTIRIETNPARDDAWAYIEAKFMSLRAQLNCAQRAIHHSDAVNTDEDVLLAGHSLGEVCDELLQLHDRLDEFHGTYISKARVVS